MLTALLKHVLEGVRAWRHRGAAADLARARNLQLSGDLAGARALCEGILSHHPHHAGAHSVLGLVCGKAGEIDRAYTHLNEAARLAPELDEAHLGLGNVHLMRGDLESAAASYRRAIALDDGSAAAHFSLGRALRYAARSAEALQALSRAHELAPQMEEVTWDLVQLLLEFEQIERARAVAEGAIRLNGKSAVAHKALGLVRLHLHEPQPAYQHFRQSLALAPGDAETLTYTGVAAQGLLRLDEALAAYDRALELDPGYVEAKWRKSLLELAQGRFESGWADYEARHLSEDRPQRRFPHPRWQGEPLHGKTMLVYAEQGLGDEIMFASCLPEIVKRARLCIIDCHSKLESVFRRSFPGARVHGGLQTDAMSWLSAYPTPDYQIAIGSLPLYLRRSVADFPAHRGYLKADPQRIAHWRERLSTLGAGLKVGVSWQGGTQKTRSPLRSIPLPQWLPILDAARAHFVSLQYGDCGGALDEFAARHGKRITHWREVIEDYDETAALLCALDVVISVCTAVIHLGGALGRPVWIMAPYSPEWRYGFTGAGMPWYPSVRLFRQPSFGEWAPVIAAVAGELRALEQGAATL